MKIIIDTHVKEDDIALLVDGEATAEERTVLMNRILESPRSLRHLENLMYQKILLREWSKSRT